jgi:hypothetical protein
LKERLLRLLPLPQQQ